MPVEFPAVADMDVVLALKAGAERAGIPYRLGITQSKDSFYGEIEPERMPVSEHLLERWKAWVMGGAVCSEMESAVLCILSSMYRKRASGVMLMSCSMYMAPKPEAEMAEAASLFDIHRAIRTAIEGLKILIQNDKAKK
jgi:uridine phosphorylase